MQGRVSFTETFKFEVSEISQSSIESTVRLLKKDL